MICKGSSEDLFCDASGHSILECCCCPPHPAACNKATSQHPQLLNSLSLSPFSTLYSVYFFIFLSILFLYFLYILLSLSQLLNLIPAPAPGPQPNDPKALPTAPPRPRFQRFLRNLGHAGPSLNRNTWSTDPSRRLGLGGDMRRGVRGVKDGGVRIETMVESGISGGEDEIRETFGKQPQEESRMEKWQG